MMKTVSAAVVVQIFYSHNQSFFFNHCLCVLSEHSELSQLLCRLECTHSCIPKTCLQHIEHVCAVTELCTYLCLKPQIPLLYWGGGGGVSGIRMEEHGPYLLGNFCSRHNWGLIGYLKTPLELLLLLLLLKQLLVPQSIEIDLRFSTIQHKPSRPPWQLCLLHMIYH